jgi:hypothetical protein
MNTTTHHTSSHHDQRRCSAGFMRLAACGAMAKMEAIQPQARRAQPEGSPSLLPGDPAPPLRLTPSRRNSRTPFDMAVLEPSTNGSKRPQLSRRRFAQVRVSSSCGAPCTRAANEVEPTESAAESERRRPSVIPERARAAMAAPAPGPRGAGSSTGSVADRPPPSRSGYARGDRDSSFSLARGAGVDGLTPVVPRRDPRVVQTSRSTAGAMIADRAHRTSSCPSSRRMAHLVTVDARVGAGHMEQARPRSPR